VDTSKVSPGEMIAGISALALFIFLFLPWYGVGIDSIGGFEVGELGDVSAWEAFGLVDILLFLVSVVVVGLVLARAADAMPELPQSPALIIAAAGGLALLLVLFRLLVAPDFGEADVSRKIGIFLGLLASAGIAYGGWRAMNEPVAAGPRSRDDRGTPPASRAPSTSPSTPAGGAAPSAGGAPSAADPPAPSAGASPAGGTAPPAGSSTPPPAPPSGGQTPQPTPPSGGQTPQP